MSVSCLDARPGSSLYRLFEHFRRDAPSRKRDLAFLFLRGVNVAERIAYILFPTNRTRLAIIQIGVVAASVGPGRERYLTNSARQIIPPEPVQRHRAELKVAAFDFRVKTRIPEIHYQPTKQLETIPKAREAIQLYVGFRRSE